MIDYCYHTHTYRCGHAEGKEEEYVLAAIEAGVKVLGFSDHIFLPDVEQPGTRGSYYELDDYIYTIQKLKRKYADKIEIYLGFEAEFGEKYLDYYHYLKEIKGIDYLILGQHLFFEDDQLIWLHQYSTPEETLEVYVNTLISAMKTGLFAYIAHPDICLRLFKKITPFVEAQLRKLCLAAENYNIPLEINLCGMRHALSENDDRLKYPNEEFFKIVSEYNCRVVIGFDAHSPIHFFDHPDFVIKAEDIIKKYHLNHISRLNLKKS